MKKGNINGKNIIFKLAKIIARLLLVADFIFMGVFIYSIRGKISLSNISLNGKVSVANVTQVVAALCTAVFLIILQKILAKQEQKYFEEKKLFARKLKLEKEREQERKKIETNTPAIDLDKALENVHPDLKNLIITNRNIHEYIPKSDSTQAYIGTEPSLIDEYLPANLEIDPGKEFVRKLSTGLSGLSYSLITPNQRGMYFKFLEKPYEQGVDVGYVMIFFFGLERQLVHGEGGRAADVMGELRRVHSDKTFMTLSFNALVYFCKKNETFLDFLKSSYYHLNLDFTIYYHLRTDKIFPSEAMIRFKKHFNFPDDAAEINPVLFKEEIDLLLGSDSLFINKNKKPVYSLEKYAHSSMPRLANLPFPSNRSMDKLTSEYFQPKHLYDIEPFKDEISDLLSRAYMNVIKNHLNFSVKRTD